MVEPSGSPSLNRLVVKPFYRLLGGTSTDASLLGLVYQNRATFISVEVNYA
ncbi:hypothetical protein [Vibrio coralliilyticus]|uniref:hypothetical protein n=1 Tax=Vibrio coralliilyticus TaxID=190893 RepID=UPI0017E658D5|nr:hypothetical protein [Vibrio coralliilyticus]NUW66928.1 hypothetical protein [Vibrio coralliilyticus]NUW70898.1 hypothetical protein [Vibrio coralliilyticus]